MSDKFHKKNKIIWVFGGSGAGKERFIKYVSQKRPPALLKHLGWDEGMLKVCTESIDWVAVNRRDNIIKKRKALPNIVASLIVAKSSIILIKGQDVDIRYDNLEVAKKLMPDAVHSIIYLHIPIETAYNRWGAKPWRKFWHTRRTVRYWYKYQLSLLQNLLSAFPITALDSSHNNYEEIIFPPKL